MRKLVWLTAGALTSAASTAECPTDGDYRTNPTSAKKAYEAFWNTGGATFWGSSNHIELFMERLRERAPAANLSQPILMDAGAAPYNTIGGDISHVLSYFRLWGCSGNRGKAQGRPARKADSAALIMGFEPMQHPFSRLVSSVKAVLPPEFSVKVLPNGVSVLDERGRHCIVLRNRPASDTERESTRCAGLEPIPSGGGGDSRFLPLVCCICCSEH